MSKSIVLKGAEVKLYIGGKLYPEARSISFTKDYGQQPIYGIDSVFPQEIATTRVSVQGQVSGVLIKFSGGLQGKGAVPRISDLLPAPYVAIRVQDRFTQQDILFLPQAMINSESISVQAKGVVSLSFSFKGIIPYGEIDIG